MTVQARCQAAFSFAMANRTESCSAESSRVDFNERLLDIPVVLSIESVVGEHYMPFLVAEHLRDLQPPIECPEIADRWHLRDVLNELVEHESVVRSQVRSDGLRKSERKPEIVWLRGRFVYSEAVLELARGPSRVAPSRSQ